MCLFTLLANVDSETQTWVQVARIFFFLQFLTHGYDLRLEGTSLSFNYNSNSKITASDDLSTNRWYHIAVTFDGGNYILYVDGIDVGYLGGAAGGTDAWLTASVNFNSATRTDITIRMRSGGSSSFGGAAGDIIYLKNILKSSSYLGYFFVFYNILWNCSFHFEISFIDYYEYHK